MQAAVETVDVDDSVGATASPWPPPPASHPQVLVGCVAARLAGAAAHRPRATPCIDGRDFVMPEDVKAVAQPVLAHRITLQPELWMSRRHRPPASSSAVLAQVATPVRARDR